MCNLCVCLDSSAVVLKQVNSRRGYVIGWMAHQARGTSFLAEHEQTFPNIEEVMQELRSVKMRLMEQLRIARGLPEGLQRERKITVIEGFIARCHEEEVFHPLFFDVILGIRNAITRHRGCHGCGRFDIVGPFNTYYFCHSCRPDTCPVSLTTRRWLYFNCERHRQTFHENSRQVSEALRQLCRVNGSSVRHISQLERSIVKIRRGLRVDAKSRCCRKRR